MLKKLWESYVKEEKDVADLLKKFKKIAKHALKGLALLHSKDLIHGDVHEGNVFKIQSEKGKDVFQLADRNNIGTHTASREDLTLKDIEMTYDMLERMCRKEPYGQRFLGEDKLDGEEELFRDFLGELGYGKLKTAKDALNHDFFKKT